MCRYFAKTNTFFWRNQKKRTPTNAYTKPYDFAYFAKIHFTANVQKAPTPTGKIAEKYSFYQIRTFLCSFNLHNAIYSRKGLKFFLCSYFFKGGLILACIHQHVYSTYSTIGSNWERMHHETWCIYKHFASIFAWTSENKQNCCWLECKIKRKNWDGEEGNVHHGF